MKKDSFLNGLMQFLDASPTPFHAVLSMEALLKQGGFERLSEGAAWKLKPGGKYWVTRNASSIIAFRLGENLVENGFRLVGAHTDSPCLRVKPHSLVADRHFTRLAVEVYGSPLLATWFDRDLSLAGRLYFRKGKSVESAIVNFEKPVAVVPNLAIHLNRSANENRTINKQTEMLPLIGHASAAKALQDAVLEAAGEGATELISHDLYLYDTQKAAVVGLESEFFTSARIDNLLSCYAGTQALLSSTGEATAVLVCNDHEEVGSQSASGADGTFLKSVLERLAGTGESFARAAAHSMMVSSDNAHGIHPAYPEKHDPMHAPILNQGPAVKVNANQRYATSSESWAFIAQCFQAAGVEQQLFASRNDMPCGSTIGPITASQLGIATVDVGAPTFAMHSIRELAGTKDAEMLSRVLGEFFRQQGRS